MTALLWFLGGLILAGVVSAAILFFFKAKARRQQPLPPEMLPKDWASVMPREKSSPAKKSAKQEPSFRKVGVKLGSNGRPASKLK